MYSHIYQGQSVVDSHVAVYLWSNDIQHVLVSNTSFCGMKLYDMIIKLDVKYMIKYMILLLSTENSGLNLGFGSF